MLSKQVKDELTVQLILMGLSLAASILLYWLVLMPQWKRQTLMLRMVKAADNGSSKVKDLTAREALLVREFMHRVSEWDHEQVSKSKSARPEARDSPA